MSTFMLFAQVLHRTCLKLPSSGFYLANGSVLPLGIRSPFGVHILNQTRYYAARKGTREKRLKLKQARKLKAVKKDLLPTGSKFQQKVKVTIRERTNMYHPTREPVDDVWLRRFHKRKTYPILEAIEMHRELHHPTMLDLPDAPLYLMLELDMSLEKQNKFLDAFSGIVANPHYFSDGKNRDIMAFCKNEQGQKDAEAAGATVAGGLSLIKKVNSGDVIPSEYDYIVAHSDIISDLGSIRGVMKKNYPSTAKGSIGMDMHNLVKHFKLGIEYNVEKDSIHHNFGFLEVNVGHLNMPAEHLEANIGAVIESVCTHRLSRLGPFITIALLLCPPSKENFAINVSKYMPSIPVDQDDDEAEPDAIKQ